MAGQSLPLIQVSSPSPLTLEILLLQTWVRFNLIDSGHYSRSLDDHVQVLLTKVGNSDSPDLAVTIPVNIHDCFPSLNDTRSIGVDEDLGLVVSQG